LNNPVKFKKLHLFYLASAALLSAGWMMSLDMDFGLFAFLLYCNFNGIFLVYRLNDCIDQDKDLKLNLKTFFSFRLHQFIVFQFVLVLMPLAFILLPTFSLFALAFGAVIGSFYSLSFNLGKKQFRIKNVFLLKNILIGLVWGALVLIGAGHVATQEVMVLFGFTTIQVLIGSMIRDVPDIDKDKDSGVKSLPVVVGMPFTFSFMHTLNLLSIAIVYLLEWDVLWVVGLGSVILWRLINLVMLQRDHENRFWGQTFNLMCCVLIFLITLIIKFYGNH
jgi:4-hydroxybenzoate polyprenyltransferase